MGFEPTTLGSTARCSTAELRSPPQQNITRPCALRQRHAGAGSVLSWIGHCRGDSERVSLFWGRAWTCRRAAALQEHDSEPTVPAHRGASKKLSPRNGPLARHVGLVRLFQIESLFRTCNPTPLSVATSSAR